MNSQQTQPNVHDVLRALRELEKHPAVATYRALVESLSKKDAVNVVDATRPTDTERLDWLERQLPSSRTGISFDQVRSIEGEPGGVRYMRRGHIGEPCKNIRAAIDRHIKMGRDNG